MGSWSHKKEKKCTLPVNLKIETVKEKLVTPRPKPHNAQTNQGMDNTKMVFRTKRDTTEELEAETCKIRKWLDEEDDEQ